MFRREGRRRLMSLGYSSSSVKGHCQQEPVQKAKLKASISCVTLPATVTTSSLGRPNILFSVSNTMNTELGAS